MCWIIVTVMLVLCPLLLIAVLQVLTVKMVAADSSNSQARVLGL